MTGMLSPSTLAFWAAMSLIPMALIAGMVVMLRQSVRSERMSRRLREVISGPSQRRAPASDVASQFLHGVTKFGHAVANSGVLSTKALAGIRKQLATAGLRGGNAVGLFLGAKIILGVLLPIAAIFALPGDLTAGMFGKLLVAAAAVFGLLFPDWVLRFISKRYTAAVEGSLPDMLDMLVMCTESGLSLEPAISRVGSEIALIHPQMAQELKLTSSELQILSDTRIAFTNMGERSGVRGLRRLASTLIQTLQYGTPLAPSLRSLTIELRQEMLSRFEERAGRLPALLTVVMIIFILPSLFLTIGGPAIIQVVHQLRS